jgi:hypothetical protein
MRQHQSTDRAVLYPKHLLEACAVTRAISLPGAFLVFLLFWTVAYPAARGRIDVQVLGFFTHGVNAVLVAIDVLISALPFPLQHMWYFIEYGAVYVLFSVVFWLADAEHPCNCPRDRNNFPGCSNEGDSNGDDRCRYIYAALNWAPERIPLTIALLAVVFLVLTPIAVMLCHYAALCSHERAVRIECWTYFKGELDNSRIRPLPQDASTSWAVYFAQSPLLSARLYLQVRVALCVGIIAILGWSLAIDVPNFWGIYLTNWTLTIETVYMILALVAAVLAQQHLEV